MNCKYCKGTGKYKEPKNKDLFDRLVDAEMDKAYLVNYAMAEEKAYKEVGYILIKCPFCKTEK